MDDEYHFHEPSYRWGLEIGLGTALHCRDKQEIADTLATVTRPKNPKPVNGEPEWQSWMVELEMQSWRTSDVS
jgi:hypothetical protein